MRKIKSLTRVDKKDILIIFFTIVCVGIFVHIFTTYLFAKDLTSKESIMNKNDTGLILLDRHGTPFFTFYQTKYKTFIPLKDIPEHVQQAVIASEDKDFYKHRGYSLPAIVRSMLTNIMQKAIVYGGSTITQQLVKNALLTPRKDIIRKVQEIVLAEDIEKKYTKKEILEMYFNSVYFGEGAFGIENAAKVYFDKHAKKLTIAEAAFLTAILPSPSRFSPYSGDIQQAQTRQKLVLQKMFEQGFITAEQKKQAEKEKLAFHPTEPSLNIIAPHFALMVKDALLKQYGEEYLSRSGMKVKTTIDLAWQKKAEAAVKEQVTAIKNQRVTNGAAIAMDPKSGDIKALVGSVDWYNRAFGTVNMAITPRSVGSSFKPIVYAAAFEKHSITPATTLHDKPTTFPGDYAPSNYDRTFRGDVLVRRALANSLNVPAVEVLQKVGIPSAIDMAEQLGITSFTEKHYGLSMVLGTQETQLLELTNAYSAFANNGIRSEPRIILSIFDKNGKKIAEPPIKQTHALEKETAFLISSILSDKQARREAFGNVLDIPRPAAVKTGTSENYKDSLTVGYTPSMVIGVWVGNNDNEPMDTVAGSLGAAPIWKKLMQTYLAGTKIESFIQPRTIAKALVCSNGGLATQREHYSSASAEYFIQGTQPIKSCSIPRPQPTQTLFSTEPDIPQFLFEENHPEASQSRGTRQEQKKKDRRGL